MKMQVFILASVCFGSLATNQDDSLSLLQASAARRVFVQQKVEYEAEKEDVGIVADSDDFSSDEEEMETSSDADDMAVAFKGKEDKDAEASLEEQDDSRPCRRGRRGRGRRGREEGGRRGREEGGRRGGRRRKGKNCGEDPTPAPSTKPATPVTTGVAGNQICDKAPTCVMSLKSMTKNTLHLKGGEIVYSQVCDVNGAALDLVVTAGDTYRPRDASRNGLSGSFGRVCMRGPGKADFTFSFYETGTKTPVVLDAVEFTFYDLEGSRDGTRLERLAFKNSASYSLHVKSKLVRKIDAAGNVVQFTAGKKSGLVKNPKKPNKLTTAQKQFSIQVRYEKVSKFTATYSILGGKDKGGRSLFFAGLGALPEVCDATKCVQKKDCSLSFHKVVQNNLGGVGPDTGAQELRYDSICDVNGKIDMVVTAVTPYSANNPSKNGISGLYGNINLLGGTKVDLNFQFVKSGTLEPVSLPTTDLTMFDMDGKTGVQEVVTASGYDSYTLGVNSSVLQQVLSSTAPTSMFSSTETGYANERPTDPMKLTPLQERRSFSIKYVDSSSMTVGFEITGRHGDGGRNFVFAGHSTINHDMCTSSAAR